MILSCLIAVTLSGCGSSGKAKLPPANVGAEHSCPWLPEDIRRESKKYTEVPAEDLTKSQVLDLFRKYATAEVKKNLTIDRVANLYDACKSSVKKG